ncbi:hypothetical protein COV13_03530 [Candidatus Woesearchaeota archaeon CG10_big_fil_rev_8_21_14_0_10_32_9]|nr:MAG: hypothetical protein COV13_03530 [Candidatus Woesearchaeota archaeon CG10_big_fil_rev_8_21_14_0_10_32_9]
MIEVSIQNKPYQDIEGKLWLPKNPVAGIIITHSWRNSMNEPMCSDAAQYFYDLGYSVLQINLPGHAKNDPLRNLSFKSATLAIDNAVDYLKKKSGVKKIFGFGISLGNAAIGFNEHNLFTAEALLSYGLLINPKSLYERYKDQINSQLNEINTKGYAVMDSTSGRGIFEMGTEWINEMKNDSSKYSKIFANNNTPVLLIQGTKDERFNEARYRAFSEQTGKDYLYVEGADHNFKNIDHRKEVLIHVKDYFSRFL